MFWTISGSLAEPDLTSAKIVSSLSKLQSITRRTGKRGAFSRSVIGRCPHELDNSAGGPLICADEDFVRGWLGVRGLSFRTEGVGSDYEVACKTTAFLEVLAKDGANALVLGDEPFQSSFFETHRGEFSIARWIFAESVSMEDVLPGCIGDLVEVAPPAVFAVNQGVMYLFDSGMPGRNAIESSVERTGGFKDCSKALLSPGVYSVTTERLELKKSYRFLVHRFVQA